MILVVLGSLGLTYSMHYFGLSVSDSLLFLVPMIATVYLFFLQHISIIELYENNTVRIVPYLCLALLSVIFLYFISKRHTDEGKYAN
jgi:hypothetical protein